MEGPQWTDWTVRESVRAVAEMREAVELAERPASLDDPRTLCATVTRAALAHLLADRIVPAEALLRDALTQRAIPPASARACVLNGLALCALHDARPADAARHLRHALATLPPAPDESELSLASPGRESWLVRTRAQLQLNLCEALRRQSALDATLDSAREAVRPTSPSSARSSALRLSLPADRWCHSDPHPRAFTLALARCGSRSWCSTRMVCPPAWPLTMRSRPATPGGALAQTSASTPHPYRHLHPSPWSSRHHATSPPKQVAHSTEAPRPTRLGDPICRLGDAICRLGDAICRLGDGPVDASPVDCALATRLSASRRGRPDLGRRDRELGRRDRELGR